MGAASSTSKSKIARPLSFASKLTNSTEKQLIVGTKDVRDMADTLFNFMYKTWDNKELWDMADRPQEYVIALSDLIEQHFISVGYTTKRNHLGEIYFLRYDKLKPPADSVKHKENAQVIAFYFIRIFQILGAMLLVIKDVSFPITDQQGTRNLGKPDGRVDQSRLQQLGQFIQVPRTFQSGGSRVDPNLPLGPYEFLRYYLRDVTEDMLKEYQEKYKVSNLKPIDPEVKLFQITSNLFFEYTPIKTSSRILRPENKFPQRFILLTSQTNESQSIPYVDIISISPEVYTPVELPYVSPASVSSSDKPISPYPEYIKLQLGTQSQNKKNTVEFHWKAETLKNSGITTFDKGIEYKIIRGEKKDTADVIVNSSNSTSEDQEPSASSRIRFGKLLQLLVLLSIKDDPSNKTRKLLPISSGSKDSKPTAIGEMPNKLRNPAMDEIYQLLKGRKNQPHCLARAIQLLEPGAINKTFPESGKGGVKTSICKFSLGDKSDTVRLDQYIPTKALAQLFGKVDKAKFEQSTNVIKAFVGSQADKTPISVEALKAKGQVDEAKELQEALDRLTAAFKIIDPDGKPKKVKSFSEITVSKPGECSKNPDENLKTPTLERVHATANALIQYHINNTINITVFLEKIFNIDKEPGTADRWYVPIKKDPMDPNPRKDERLIVKGINENILLGGFPILDQITDNARDLLVEYYEKCEMLYQTGLASWKQGVPDTAAVVNPLKVPHGSNDPAAVAPQVHRQGSNYTGNPKRYATTGTNNPRNP